MEKLADISAPGSQEWPRDHEQWPLGQNRGGRREAAVEPCAQLRGMFDQVRCLGGVREDQPIRLHGKQEVKNTCLKQGRHGQIGVPVRNIKMNPSSLVKIKNSNK